MTKYGTSALQALVARGHASPDQRISSAGRPSEANLDLLSSTLCSNVRPEVCQAILADSGTPHPGGGHRQGRGEPSPVRG